MTKPAVKGRNMNENAFLIGGGKIHRLAGERGETPS